MFTINAIIPDGQAVNVEELLKAVTDGMDIAADGVHTDFLTTVQTWNHPVDFKIAAQGPFRRDVYAEDEIYGWINNGTEAHIITPVTKRVLRFAVGGMAKTQPGFVGSTSGQAGREVVWAKWVNHPGTRARRFDEQIAAKWQDEMARIVQSQIERVK